MALVPCRECGKEVSDAAEKCPNCGISTPSKKRRQVKLITTLVIVILVVSAVTWASVWTYNKVSSVFVPAPMATDSTGAPIPKLRKTAPVKEQIIQKDYKDKVGEMIDSDKSVREISNETGLSKKEIKKIKKEKLQKQKEAEEAAAAKK